MATPLSRKKRTMIIALSVLGFALIHFVFSFFISFAAGIGGNTSSGGVFTVISRVLTFPLWLIKGDEGSGSDQTLLSWWPWAALSLTWGSLITFGISLLRR